MIVYDLEWTAWEGSWARRWTGPGEHREIVQIGAVKLAPDFTELDAVDLIVRPRINPVLSQYFIDLTGIAQERVEREGDDIAEALERFARFCGDDPEICSNGPDHLVIAENCRMFDLPVPMNGRWRDVHSELCAISGQAGVMSSDLNVLLGLGRDGDQAHDALADARAVAAAMALAQKRK